MAGGSARYRTAGGWHIELDLPLSDRDSKRVERGELVRVDADGNPAPARDEPGEPGGGEPPRTGKGSTRAAWAAYALTLGMPQPEDAAREDIIDALVSAGKIKAE